MDEVTNNIQQVLWCMLFVDYIVFIDKASKGINQDLKL